MTHTYYKCYATSSKSVVIGNKVKGENAAS